MIPSATYRIQFRNGMTFDRAAALAPYLKDLGISHLYASPIFTATSGSTHGYDITDPNEIDPAIGGREGFDRMVKALRNAQIGLILDIVPNHMATSLENRWWRDVIEQGKNSAWAHYFDIDWTRPVTLPFLGDTFEAELESGALALKRDPETGKPAFVYYDQAWPLNPQTLATGEQLLTSPDRDAILALHEAQSWRLMSWREAPRQLSWRRFFEITGLIGVRVEDPAVFDDTHRLILELVHSGIVDGLRIDHIDGLADPLGYLQRLRQATGPECYITVEKILAKGEQLPADWPVSGTTGYEFIASLAEVLVDDNNLDQLQQVRKLGSMKSLLGMIPGMAQHRKELEQFDEREIDRTEAIIRSMTPAERRDPSIINGSRRARIAYGSGVTVSQVNALLQRFEQAAKMMKRMSNRGGMGGGIPGFGGPAMGGGKKKGKNKKKGGKSGNPMKREAEEKALRDKLAGKSSGSTGGSAFAKKPQNPALPAGLEQMMGNVDGGTELPPNLGGGLGGLFGR